MDEESAMLSGALVRVLRVLCVFGVAPLRFKRRYTVTVARVWTERRWYGYVVATVLNIMMVSGALMTVITNIRIKYSATLVGRVLMLVTISNTVLLISHAAYGAHKRMKHLLPVLRQLHKITIMIPKESIILKDRKRTREVTIVLVVVIFEAVISLAISSYIIVCCDSSIRDVLVTLFFTAAPAQAVIVTMLALQMVEVIRMMRKAVESYNLELKRLLDAISAGHRREATLLKLEESLWRISRYYLAFCENVRSMISNDGMVMLQVIIFFILQLMNNSFRILVAVRILSLPNEMGGPIHYLNVVIMLHLYLSILYVIMLWALSNACDKIHEEVQKMRALVSEVIYRGRGIGDTFSTAMDALSQQMLIHQPSFKPLNICALNRSLFVTVISGVITYLVTIIKFYTMEATSTY